MKIAISMALVVLLLGMPLGCILSTSPAAHPCCPRTSANLKCPYDLFDSAKASSHIVVAVAPVPVAVETNPPGPGVSELLATTAPAATNDLYISYRILRI
jgi:hypothetical protein